MAKNFHHEHQAHGMPVETSSDRSFGFVFAAFFTIISLYPLRHQQEWRPWALVLAAVFLVLSLTKPETLKVLNKWWTQLGLLLGKIVSPIVLSIFFFCFLTPMGLLMRVLRKDILNLKLDPHAKSYWVVRERVKMNKEDLRRQF